MTYNLKSVTSLTYIFMCMVPFGDPRGLYSLYTATEFKSDLRFEISDLNYICNSSFKVNLLVKKDFVAR